MERRHLVGGGLIAGLASLVATDSSDAASQRGNDGDQLVASTINDLRRTFERQFDATQTLPWHGVTQIREQQRIFIKASQKYPDFMEVGIQVWESVYDWHVRHLQPVTMTRTTDGRYTMMFMFTTLLLRPDLDSSFIGVGFDARG